MSDQSLDISEFHWMMDMLQTIDVGLVVLDKDFRIQVWNSFMENHSGLGPQQVKDKSIFESFKEIPQDWLMKKARSVFLLKCRTFTTWEQRPYVFKFKNYRPITGTASYMYQNTTIIPLESSDGKVNHVCMIIYDVTDTAVNRLALKKANATLEHLSQTDRLTQLNNRGHWEECLNKEFKRCKRYNTISSLIMFDIDHFKRVNDTYGHQPGDEVIKQVAKALQDSLRETDIAGRYGGEEFAVLLSDTHSENAYALAERLRNRVENMEVNTGEHKIKFTISIGIAEFNDKLSIPTDWIKQADQALYFCKENGRNQTSVYKT